MNYVENFQKGYKCYSIANDVQQNEMHMHGYWHFLGISWHTCTTTFAKHRQPFPDIAMTLVRVPKRFNNLKMD